MEAYDILSTKTKSIFWADLCVDYELVVQTFISKGDFTYAGFVRVFDELKVADIFCIAIGRGDDPDAHYREAVKLILNTAKEFWLNRYEMPENLSATSSSSQSSLDQCTLRTNTEKFLLKSEQLVCLKKQICGFWLAFTLWFIAPLDDDRRISVTLDDLKAIEKWTENIEGIPFLKDGLKIQLHALYKLNAIDFVFFKDSFDHERMQRTYLLTKNAPHIKPTEELWSKSSDTVEALRKAELLFKRLIYEIQSPKADDEVPPSKEICGEVTIEDVNEPEAGLSFKGQLEESTMDEVESTSTGDSVHSIEGQGMEVQTIQGALALQIPIASTSKEMVPWMPRSDYDKQKLLELEIGKCLVKKVQDVVVCNGPASDIATGSMLGCERAEMEIEGMARKVKETLQKQPGPPTKKYQSNIFGTATEAYKPGKRPAKSTLVQNVWGFIKIASKNRDLVTEDKDKN